MTLATWLLFVPVALTVSLVPGPAFLTVLTTSMREGARAGASATMGILVADLVYFACAAFGLGAVLVASQTAFDLVRILGAIYLAVLGVRALVRRETAETAETAQSAVAGKSWRTGLATQLANPKIVVFIAALVPSFVDLAHPVAPQFAVLGATFVASDALVFGIVTLLAARGARVVSARFRLWTERVTGIVMLAVAGRLATQR